MKLLLIYPPFADPTQPYISLPVLKGYLAAKGVTCKTLDLNIAAVHYLFSARYLLQLKAQVQAKFREFNKKQKLDIYEQLAYTQLCTVMPFIDKLPQYSKVLPAFFKDKAAFYNYQEYYQAAGHMENVFQALNALFFPYQYGFNFAGHFILPWSIAMLKDYVREARSPLQAFYEEYFSRFFNRADWRQIEVIGISLTFVSQIPEALFLSRLLKRHKPACFILLGGACISQILYSMPDNIKQQLFAFADGICTGEGEKTLEALMALPAGQRCLADPRFAAIPNLTVNDPAHNRLHTGPAKILDLSRVPPPDYRDYDLDAYLAPGRLLLYAPTRHCYWRKCSFCTYGFSYGGNAAYCEIPAAKAAAELAMLSREYEVSHFYFSCDVLAPAYAVKLAEELLKQGVSISWSTDLRIEKQYTPDLCRYLKAAGLRSVAFGIESGSDSLLALIGKGINTATIREINRNFHKAGIATQWMTFTYHPGENTGEALQTLTLLKEEQPVIDLFVAGEFQLVPGSQVMARPEAYGISEIYFLKGDTFRLFPLFTLETPSIASTAQRERIDSQIGKLAGKYALHHYPWAGSISTHHSFLYFLKYGQRVFVKKAGLKKALQSRNQRVAGNRPVNSVFSKDRIERNIHVFYHWIREAMLPDAGRQPKRGRQLKRNKPVETGTGLPDREAVRQKDRQPLQAPLCEEYLAFIKQKIRPVVNRHAVHKN